MHFIRTLKSFPMAAEFLDGGQHDCQEVLRVLMDLLHDDLVRGSRGWVRREAHAPVHLLRGHGRFPLPGLTSARERPCAEPSRTRPTPPPETAAAASACGGRGGWSACLAVHRRPRLPARATFPTLPGVGAREGGQALEAVPGARLQHRHGAVRGAVAGWWVAVDGFDARASVWEQAWAPRGVQLETSRMELRSPRCRTRWGLAWA